MKRLNTCNRKMSTPEDGGDFPPHSIANFNLDTELGEFSDSTATLSQALTSRKQLLIADVEDGCQKFEASLS
jgi:hypothetical protein